MMDKKMTAMMDDIKPMMKKMMMAKKKKKGRKFSEETVKEAMNRMA